MNIFKSFTCTWWQVSIFKISMLSGGIVIGSYFSNFFSQYFINFGLIAIIGGIYTTYVWYNGIKNNSKN